MIIITRWILVNVDGNVKIQFSSLLTFTFNLSLNKLLVASLHIPWHLEENSEFLLCGKGAWFLVTDLCTRILRLCRRAQLFQDTLSQCLTVKFSYN